MSNTAPVEPVRDYFFVADHHADPDEVEEACRAQGVRSVKLAYVGLPVGSTSTFMAVIAAAFGLLESVGPKGRAAAALGIYTDTSALLHGTTPLDFQMFELLTRDEATEELLDDLRDYRVPPEWFEYRNAAFAHLETRGGVRIAPVGYVRDDHRDVIAEIANDLLRIEGTSIAIVVAVTQRGTEVSVRADSRLLGEDRERIVVRDRPPARVRVPGACPGSSTSAGRRTAWKAARSFPTARARRGCGRSAAAAHGRRRPRGRALPRLRPRPDRGPRGPEVRAAGRDPG